MNNIHFYLDSYRKWSTETAPSDGKTRVVIPYVSAYGFTEELASKIAEGVKAQIDDAILALYNVIYHKQEDILDKIYWADVVLFGSPTINGDALEPIMELMLKMNPLVHGGKVAGANAAGEPLEFKHFVSSVVFNAINTEIFSAGDIKPEGDNIEVLTSENAENKIYKKLFFKNES